MLRNVEKLSGAAAAPASRAVAGSSSGCAQEGQRKRAHNNSADEEEEPSRGKRGKYQKPNIRNAAAREQCAPSIATQRYLKLSAESLASVAKSSKLCNGQHVFLHPSRIQSEDSQLFSAMQKKEWMWKNWMERAP